MNPELVEKITRMIVEKLENDQGKPTPQTGSLVKFWDHRNSSGTSMEKGNPAKEVSRQTPEGSVKVWNHEEAPKKPVVTEKRKPSRNQSSHEQAKPELQSFLDAEELKHLKSKTPARIGVGRAGPRPRTSTMLKFRFDHAAAVDAVYGEVNQELLDVLDLFKVNTRVTEKDVYIRRPDYGRKLSEEAIKEIQEKCKPSPTIQIIVSDGLSSKAIDENLEDVYLSLEQSLRSMGLDTGTPFYIEKGRVAVMDDVGEILKPKVIVLLIGERPGLVSAESMSAYLCYEPRRGTIEADRMVISNIHRGGIPPVEAGAYLGTVIQKVLKYEASGVSLVNKEE